MYWYLFFVLLTIILTLPLRFNVLIRIDPLILKTQMLIRFFKFKIIDNKIKIKGKYIYVTQKGITFKEKFSTSNVDVIFGINLVREIYFRLRIYELYESGEIGVKSNAMATAISVATMNILSKSIFARVKNNKKSSHIFLSNSAKYNEDCCNIDLNCNFSINLLDVIYSFISSKLKSKGVKYERSKEREQSEGTD